MGRRAATVALVLALAAPAAAQDRIPPIPADRLTDERTGQHYYEARVELDEKAIVGDQKIYPGMPAEVIIVTAAHTREELQFALDVFAKVGRELGLI